jgi:hypothetical protein
LLAAAFLVTYLSVTARRRALEATAGLGLVAAALLSPVIYPWYVLWGALCLAPIARARGRDLLILASATSCLMALPGLPRLTVDLISVSLTACILVIVASPGALVARVTAVARLAR